MSAIEIDKISPVAETDKAYALYLGRANTLALLSAHLTEWEPLAWDARKDFFTYITTEKQFAEFYKFLLEEREGKPHKPQMYARYGSILLPAPLLVVSELAFEFKVPWGTAFIRMRQEGLLQVDFRGWVIPTKLPKDYLNKYGANVRDL